MRSRHARSCALAIAFGLVVTPGARQDEAQGVLAWARAAMGGDAALTAVKAFVVSGRATRNLGKFTADQAVEIACELPDRFVRTVTYDAAFGAPAGISMMLTNRDGFNGAESIHEQIAQGDRMPPAPPPLVAPPRTPEEKEARDRSALARQKHPFARLGLALFAASFPSFPLEFTYAGQLRLPDGTVVDAVDAKGPEDATFRLLVDATSRLPVMIVWHEKATVATTRTRTESVVTAQTGPPVQTPALPAPPPPSGRNVAVPPGVVVLDRPPAGDPTVGLPLVEHTLSLMDYRVEGDVKWPHRLVERVSGEVVEDTKFNKIKVNQKIAASKFRTR